MSMTTEQTTEKAETEEFDMNKKNMTGRFVGCNFD